MYVIAIYDVEASRTTKMLKICRKYLHWVQNSVFEGDLNEVQLNALREETKAVMNMEYDSFIIFKNRNADWLSKEIIGQEKASVDQFL